MFYSFFLAIIILVCFLVILMIFVTLDSSFGLGLSPFSCSVESWSLELGVDCAVVMCILMLTICSMIAFIYCFHYYYSSLGAFSLFYLMVWFVVIMFVLMLSSSIMLTLILWEYLGFSSFLLILFYSNSSSCRASLITLFASRIGDVGLFVLLVWMVGLDEVFSSVLFFFFFCVVSSKSALFPFSSWLLEAMRAPTPVSSLVHSSTLVAAGIWFVHRYSSGLSSGDLLVLFVVSIFTVFLTAFSALFFLDLKKIVALSTCNNIAWCMLYFCCGMYDLVVFQLFVHGVCKCVLFVLVGDLMSSSGGSQSFSGVFMSRYSGSFNVVLVVLLVFSLCGVPFLGVYFSKHYFISCLLGTSYSLVDFWLVLGGFLLSYIYSFRLALKVSSVVCGISSGYIVSFVFVGCFSFVGSFISWYLNGCFVEYNVVSVFWSKVFLFIQLVGCFLGYCFYYFDFCGWFWQSLMWGMDFLVGFFYWVYNRLVRFSILAVFRWEVFSLSFLGKMLVSFMSGVCSAAFDLIFYGVFFYILFMYYFGR